ncbi:MAG: YybS family protein [Spirochaetaceae bacterium]|nr:YybS family protein [Spirochaetaceae bacterium]
MRIGFFGFFFLVPLGIMAFGYDLRTAWSAVLGTVLLNGLLFGGIAVSKGYDPGESGRDIVYFSAMAVLFGWITAPPVSGPRFLRIRTAYRFAVGSLAGFLAFFPLISSLRNNAGFYAFFNAQMEVFNSPYVSPGGVDMVRRSLLEQLTPEILLDYLEFILIRGGGVASCMLLFFISRQTASVFTRIIRRRRPEGSLSAFHVEPGIIWVLSLSILAVLLGTWTKIAPLEIAAWNIITLCSILYLAQGGGIVLFFLNRFAFPPIFRLAVNTVLLVLLFNPGISPFILGILIVLGIAENWAPLRVQKSNGPSSTPKVEN